MKRIEQLKNLILMAAADGKITQQEIAFLAERSHQLGLSELDFQRAFQEATGGDAALLLPEEHAEKLQLLRDLLRMMAADGKLSNMEKRLFAVAAALMNIDKVEIDELIDQLVASRHVEENNEMH